MRMTVGKADYHVEGGAPPEGSGTREPILAYGNAGTTVLSLGV